MHHTKIIKMQQLVLELLVWMLLIYLLSETMIQLGIYIQDY